MSLRSDFHNTGFGIPYFESRISLVLEPIGNMTKLEYLDLWGARIYGLLHFIYILTTLLTKILEEAIYDTNSPWQCTLLKINLFASLRLCERFRLTILNAASKRNSLTSLFPCPNKEYSTPFYNCSISLLLTAYVTFCNFVVTNLQIYR